MEENKLLGKIRTLNDKIDSYLKKNNYGPKELRFQISGVKFQISSIEKKLKGEPKPEDFYELMNKKIDILTYQIRRNLEKRGEESIRNKYIETGQRIAEEYNLTPNKEFLKYSEELNKKKAERKKFQRELEEYKKRGEIHPFYKEFTVIYS